MAADQDGCCLLCRARDRQLVVDQCGTSGTVRGMLCRSCVAIVRKAEQAPAIVERLADYLAHENTTSGLASDNNVHAPTGSSSPATAPSKSRPG